LRVAAALHQDVEDVVVLIDRAPQGMPLAMHGLKHCIQRPRVPWLGTSTLQLMRIVLPTWQTPLPDGFMGDVETACKQQLVHVAGTPRAASIEPDALADDRAGQAVIVVACGGSGWRHVWLPIGVQVVLRVHRQSDYVTGQAAGSTT
jgi:hypothetical protein